MPYRVDVALAALLTAYGVTEAAVTAAPLGWYLVAVAATAPLAFRRRAPAAVIAWTVFAIALPGLLGFDDYDTVLPLPLLVVCGYTTGREAADGRLAAFGALGVIVTVILILATLGYAGDNSAAEDVVALVVVVGGSAAAGRLISVRRQENEQLHRLTGQLAAERDARAAAAVTEERTRIAREIHDVIAHSVSLIAVQAAAADELLGHDDVRARESLRAVQDTARGALAEMRRLLVVMRGADRRAAFAPQPGLDRLDELVDQSRDLGLDIDFNREGLPRPLPPGLDLAAYRIIQEALTNVRRHAGAVRTRLELEYHEHELHLRIANLAAGGDSRNDDGHGLIGIRERAHVYGGTVEAGYEEGEFVVRARLPIPALVTT